MSERRSYECDKHGTTQYVGEYCDLCMAVFRTRRDAAEMTAAERAEELRWWRDILTIPFDNLHQRIEELMGRPVWTHELFLVDQLIEEIKSEKSATFDDVLDKIPDDIPVIVVVEGEKHD